LAFNESTDGVTIEHPVCLGTGRAYRRTLAGIQHPELDAGAIGCAGHRPAQRIDFLDQMTLADAANRRVA